MRFYRYLRVNDLNMAVLLLASRIIAYRKRVTFIVVAIIAGACALFIFSNCLVEGLTNSILEKALGIAIPHIVIENKTIIYNCSKIICTLSSIENVKNYAPRINVYSVMRVNGEYSLVQLWGIDFKLESSILKFKENLIGNVSRLSNGSVIVGYLLAKNTNLSIGDNVTITYPNGFEKTYTVVSFLNTGFSEIDGQVVLVDINEIRSSLRVGKDVCSVIIVNLYDPLASSTFKKELHDKLKHVGLGNIKVKDWREIGRKVLELIDTERRYTGILVSAIAVVVGLSIVNVMFLVVESMKKQIGVLKSIGMTSTQVFEVFIILALIYATIGYTLGVVVSKITLDLIGTIEFSIGDVSYTIRPIYDFAVFTLGFLYVLVISTLSSGLASFKASRVKPVEVMRFG